MYKLKQVEAQERYKALGFTMDSLAIHSGIKANTLKSWFRKDGNERNPDSENLKKLIKVLKCNINDIAEIDPEFETGTDHSLDVITFIPMVNIAAGAGAEGLLPDLITEERIPIWTKLLNGVNPKNLTMFQVVGDSMETTIRPDDWVIIDMVNGREFHPVDGIYLINKDGSIQIKRLHFKGAKGVDIISDNKEYPVENTAADQIDMFVIGKLYRHVRTLGSLAEK